MIAAIADANALELACHGGGATILNMLLAMPNAIWMETSGVQKAMKNGEVPGPEVPGPEVPGPEVPGPEVPGMSTEVVESEIKRYRV